MTVSEIMQQLESLGSAQTKKVLVRHGAREPFYGVKVADLKNVIRDIKKSFPGDRTALPAKMHQIALELYATGNSDAMYLAGLIADPKQFDKPTLQLWVDQAYWYMLSEFTVAWMAAGSHYSRELATEWIGSDREATACSGWSTWSGIVAVTPDDQLDITALKKLITHVEENLQNSPNRVRHCMNNFLISVAISVTELTDMCRSTALNIGKVSVNMGDTACKVPYAPDYIDKVGKMGRIGKKRTGLVC